jgi:hypothetical protein
MAENGVRRQTHKNEPKVWTVDAKTGAASQGRQEQVGGDGTAHGQACPEHKVLQLQPAAAAAHPPRGEERPDPVTAGSEEKGPE